MNEYEYKLDQFLIPLISEINKPNIVEFGVQNGTSTNKFLEVCEKNDGYLFSTDVIDCSKVSTSLRWKFIKSRDDNFDLIKSIIPKNIDVIYLDSLHEAKHVKKIFYEYFSLLNINGYFFIDDISHLPYTKDKDGGNFYCEINNRETFNTILDIYNSNSDLIELNFTFKSSGLAIIKKKNDLRLNKIKKIETRKNSLKNILRLIWKNLKRD